MPTVLTGVTLAAGETITLRWSDFSATGSNDGLAVDDFTFSATLIPNVTVAQTLSDGAGYRLLSAPVQGVTVGTLATLNLVQGIPNQYVNAADNVLLRYTSVGPDFYEPATAEANPVVPGRGFFWQFYDLNISAAQANTAGLGSGTSQSFELPGSISATGTPVTVDYTTAFAATPDKFYLIGNPFARALDVAAITVPGGFQGDVVSLYRPVPAGFVTISRAAATANDRAVAVWQGFFAETVDPAAPTFSFDVDALTPTVAVFVGRPALAGGLALTLSGTTAAGVATLDDASLVRFAEAGTSGWDALDASKLTPPAGPFALVASTVERDGAPYRVSVNTLAPAAGETLVPLSVLATDAGTYTLAATVGGLPAGVTAELRDLATGAIADAATGITFETAATDWAERFVLVLRAGAVAGEAGPTARTLTAPRPNPATGRTALTLRVATAEHVTATVVDALGRTVATVFDGEATAGTDVTLSVDAANLSPGVYVVRVQGATFAESRRLTVVR